MYWVYTGLILIASHPHPTSDNLHPWYRNSHQRQSHLPGRIQRNAARSATQLMTRLQFLLSTFHQVPITAGWPGRVFQLWAERDSNPQPSAMFPWQQAKCILRQNCRFSWCYLYSDITVANLFTINDESVIISLSFDTKIPQMCYLFLFAWTIFQASLSRKLPYPT